MSLPSTPRLSSRQPPDTFKLPHHLPSPKDIFFSEDDTSNPREREFILSPLRSTRSQQQKSTAINPTLATPKGMRKLSRPAGLEELNSPSSSSTPNSPSPAVPDTPSSRQRASSADCNLAQLHRAAARGHGSDALYQRRDCGPHGRRKPKKKEEGEDVKGKEKATEESEMEQDLEVEDEADVEVEVQGDEESEDIVEVAEDEPEELILQKRHHPQWGKRDLDLDDSPSITTLVKRQAVSTSALSSATETRPTGSALTSLMSARASSASVRSASLASASLASVRSVGEQYTIRSLQSEASRRAGLSIVDQVSSIFGQAATAVASRTAVTTGSSAAAAASSASVASASAASAASASLASASSASAQSVASSISQASASSQSAASAASAASVSSASAASASNGAGGSASGSAGASSASSSATALPSSSGTDHTLRNKVIPAVVIPVGFLILLGIFICCLRRRKNKEATAAASSSNRSSAFGRSTPGAYLSPNSYTQGTYGSSGATAPRGGGNGGNGNDSSQSSFQTTESAIGVAYGGPEPRTRWGRRSLLDVMAGAAAALGTSNSRHPRASGSSFGGGRERSITGHSVQESIMSEGDGRNSVTGYQPGMPRPVQNYQHDQFQSPSIIPVPAYRHQPEYRESADSTSWTATSADGTSSDDASNYPHHSLPPGAGTGPGVPPMPSQLPYDVNPASRGGHSAQESTDEAFTDANSVVTESGGNSTQQHYQEEVDFGSGSDDNTATPTLGNPTGNSTMRGNTPVGGNSQAGAARRADGSWW